MEGGVFLIRGVTTFWEGMQYWNYTFHSGVVFVWIKLEVVGHNVMFRYIYR